MFDLKKNIGIKTFSFREIKDNAACAETILRCGSTVADLSGAHVNYDDPSGWESVIAAYRSRGVDIVGIGAVSMHPEEDWNRRYFEFCRKSGAKLVTFSFPMEDWEKSAASVEKLSEEYHIPAAIHNHGGYDWLGNSTALGYVFKRTSPRIGLCLDTAWCLHIEREDPVGWMKKFKDRIYGFHFKDFLWEPRGKHRDTVVGEGALDLPGVLAAFKELPHVRCAVLEYEGKDAEESTRRSIANIRAIY
ncbi:MAG: sugar phosphate isomerase/epimerase [Lentisphaeria bacterium]|nr:sugar phosphate isomerase/epimerase [Lentisphaeria bacterium]